MYTSMGGFPIIPAADLLDLQSAANIKSFGNSRVGTPYAVGKKGGLNAWRDAGSGAYSWVFSTGDDSSSAWRACDGSASYTPVNLSTWTVGGDSTYSAGLLTTDAGDDAAGRATQSMTLTAGRYVLKGTAAIEGSAVDYVAPRIRIGTSATNGDILTDIFLAARHNTAAESADPKEEINQYFTVAVTGTVHFTVDLVDETGTLVAGSAFILLSPIEAVSA